MLDVTLELIIHLVKTRTGGFSKCFGGKGSFRLARERHVVGGGSPSGYQKRGTGRGARPNFKSQPDEYFSKLILI